MKHILLGGLDVSRLGLGTMAMSGYYLDPSSTDAESVRTIQRAMELGATHLDGGSGSACVLLALSCR